jgi:hypothetical protein
LAVRGAQAHFHHFDERGGEILALVQEHGRRLVPEARQLAVPPVAFEQPSLKCARQQVAIYGNVHEGLAADASAIPNGESGAAFRRRESCVPRGKGQKINPI